MICFRHAEAPHVGATAEATLTVPMQVAAAASVREYLYLAAVAGAASPVGRGCWVTAHAGVSRLLGVEGTQ